MSDGTRLRNLTFIGIVFLIVGLALTWWVWTYVSPTDPIIPRQEAAQGPEPGYQPGGTDCDPKRLNALAPQKAPAERARCADAREEHRIRQAELAQANHSNRLAEANLRLANQQAQSTFLQTLSTAWAFVAAAAAAVFAGLAAYHASRSADADNKALEATLQAAAEARSDAAMADVRFREQLEKTREMVRFTAKSAKAMEHSATATRGLASSTYEAAQSQLRPYVYLESETIKIDELISLEFLADYAEIAVVLKNFGQTPARKVTLRAKAFVGGYWSQDFESDLSDATLIHLADLPPGFTREQDGFTAIDLAKPRPDINAGTASIILDGRIEYEDGSGKRYFTNFRRAASADDLWARKFVTTPGGNTAS